MTQKTVGGVVTKFFYNTEDRLERVEEGDGTLIAVYYYDPFGRRLWKEVGGDRTYFLYSDEGLIGEYDDSGTEIKIYGYKPGSTWTTDPLFMKQNNQYYFYHTDHIGTPQKLTSTNGAVLWAATYTSFGEATVDASSTITNNLRYPGQFYDEETGLHYNLFRHYDPQDGRYLRFDPSLMLNPQLNMPFLLNKQIKSPEGLNPYLYTENNPVTFIDILGLCKWKGWLTLFGGGLRIWGGAYFSLELSSECCDGYKVEDAKFRGGLMGISIGIWYVPIQAFSSEVELEGPSPPEEDDGQGAVSFISFAGTVGTGYGAALLGSGKLFDPGSISQEYGFDVGIDLMFGYARGRGKRVRCECE